MFIQGSEPGIIELDDLVDDYSALVRTVAYSGHQVSPRGIPCRELRDQTLVLRNPRTVTLPIGIGRGCNPAIAAVEALQLIGGFGMDRLVHKVAPNTVQFTEPSGYFHGNYGRRVGSQLVEVYRKLTEDPDTRQAHITLWDPALDNEPGKKDYPCTLSLSFALRDNELDMHTTMRSNDVWWGVAYDIFQFTQLQLTLAALLNVEAGKYMHTALSLHVYDRDLEAIAALHPVDVDTSVSLPYGLAIPADTPDDVKARAFRITTGNQPVWRGTPPNVEWYIKQIAPFVPTAPRRQGHFD